jgi:hypothetical protein
MYKLTISDTVEFPVKLSVNDAGAKKEFSLRLQGKRITQDALRTALTEQAELSTDDFLRQHISGWREQRLVIDEAGNPAPFGPEAFDALLSLMGASGLIFGAYLESLGQSAGAGGRAKN